MAGPFDIQRFPWGLLDVFNMKAGGDTPHQLAREVSPSVEALPFYLQGVRRTDFAPISLSAGGGFAGLSTPRVGDNEIWIVTNLSLTLTAGVGTSGQWAPAYRVDTNASSPNFLVGAPLTAVASATVKAGYQFAVGELILLPGYQLGVYGNNVVAPPLTSALINVDCFRLSI